jgi:hypothetical protein
MAALSAGQLATGQTGEEGALAVISGLAGLLYIFLFIATAVLVCMWFYRATQHGLARGASLEASSPGEAVVSWFLPFLNMVRPFNIVRGLLASAGLDMASVSAWQGMWLVGGIISRASGKMEPPAALGFSVLSNLLLLGAGITAAQIVNRLKWRAA